MHIRVQWHHQPKLNQPSTPDRTEGDTLELNSALPIQHVSADNEVHRGTKYTEEIPPEWSWGHPSPRPAKRPAPGKKSPSPSPPPDGAGARDQGPFNPGLQPPRPPSSLLHFKDQALTYSKDTATALQGVPMAQGADWVPNLHIYQEQVLQRDNPPEPTPIYTIEQKAHNCCWHKGTPLYARAGIQVHPVGHLTVPERLSVHEVFLGRLATKCH